MAVSSEYPQIIESLEQQGIRVLQVMPCRKLDFPVASHADMQLLHLGGKQVLVSPYQDKLAEQLKELGMEVIIGETLGEKYPTDVLYNIAVMDTYYICNYKTISKTVKELLNKHHQIQTKQGYSKCSTCIVDEKSIITSDSGIAKAVEPYGISVLKIRSGYIKIPKYDTGFIGGCCGKLQPNLLAFTGNISNHPDYKQIQKFLKKREIEILNLTKDELMDVGGIIPLMEENHK